MNAIDRYSVARPRSAAIMSFFRSSRSTNDPAIGPNRNAGSVRASITPEIASDAEPPPRPCTIAVTATNPTQSPNDDTDIAASSRANGPWVRRSRRVAGRVPRRAATSSVIDDRSPALGFVARGCGGDRGGLGRSTARRLALLRRCSLLRGRLLLGGRLLLRSGLLAGRRLLLGGLGRRARGTRGGLRCAGLGLGLGVTFLGLHHVEVELRPAAPAPDRLRALDEQRSVDGTPRLLQRLVVDGEVALGISVAPVEHAESRALLDDVALVALWARDAEGPRRVLLDVPAVGIPAAAHERTEPADTPLQLASAIGTLLVEGLGLGPLAPIHVADVAALRIVGAPDELAVAPELDLELAGLASFGRAERAQLVEVLLVALERVLRLLERALERPVELVEHLNLPELALGDVVELLLHEAGEVDVDDVGEVLDQLVGHDVADVLRLEPAVLQAHVPTVLDRRDDRRVDRRAADALLLKLLHERGLGVARRRLGEVLLGQDLEDPERPLRGELGEIGFGVLVDLLVVAALAVELEEPVEHERLPRGAQPVDRRAARGLDVDADLIELRLGHLGRDGALPDQGVQAELVAVQHSRHPWGCAHRAGRADRLVRLLRVAAPRLVPTRLGDRVRLAVLGLDELRDLAERRIGDRHGVGTHVGDQANRALTGQVDPLVQALRDLHRAPRAEAELARSLLLQGRGRERRRRGPLAPLLLDGRGPVAGVPERVGVRVGVPLRAEHDALLVGAR